MRFSAIMKMVSIPSQTYKYWSRTTEGYIYCAETDTCVRVTHLRRIHYQ